MNNQKIRVKLDSISRIKKYGDPESRKYLLEMAKDTYELVNKDIVTLVESLELDIDKHPENVEKLLKISIHMTNVSVSLDEVFNSLETMLTNNEE